MGRNWILVDANYLAHRAFHSMGGLEFKGQLTGVVYGFLRNIKPLIDRFASTRFAFCFDSAERKRCEYYPEYKSKRTANRLQPQTKKQKRTQREFYSQIDMLRTSYLRTIGFRNIFHQDGYEGDDLIAMCCRALRPQDTAVIISSDQDLWQCLSPQVSFYNPMQKLLVTDASFRKQWELAPARWVDCKAIAGCKGDGVPGVEGVGDKIAAKFVRGAGVSDNIRHRIWEFENKGLLKRNIKLVKLPYKGCYPIEFKKDHVTMEGWVSITRKLGFESMRDIGSEFM